MARASVAAENAALTGIDSAGLLAFVTLNVGDPGTTGANENANSGSYAAQACPWNAPSGGSKTNSTSPTFSTGGTVAVTYFGTKTVSTYGSGTYGIGGALSASVTATTITIAPGALTLSAS